MQLISLLSSYLWRRSSLTGDTARDVTCVRANFNNNRHLVQLLLNVKFSQLVIRCFFVRTP